MSFATTTGVSAGSGASVAPRADIRRPPPGLPLARLRAPPPGGGGERLGTARRRSRRLHRLERPVAQPLVVAKRVAHRVVAAHQALLTFAQRRAVALAATRRVLATRRKQ